MKPFAIEWFCWPAVLVLVCAFSRRPDTAPQLDAFATAEAFTLVSGSSLPRQSGWVEVRMHEAPLGGQSVSVPREDDDLSGIDERQWQGSGDGAAVPSHLATSTPLMPDDAVDGVVGDEDAERKGLSLDEAEEDPVNKALQKFGWLSREVLQEEWAVEEPVLADELLIEFSSIERSADAWSGVAQERFWSPLDEMARDRSAGDVFGLNGADTDRDLAGAGGLAYDDAPLLERWKPSAPASIRLELPEQEKPTAVYTPAKRHFEDPGKKTFTPGLPRF